MPEKRLLYEIGNFRFWLTLTAAIGTLGGITVIAQANLLARLINGAFLSKQPLDALGSLLILFAAIVMVRAVLAWVADVTAHGISFRVRGYLRLRMIARFFALGPNYLRGKRTGELVSILTDGVESLDSYVAGYLPQVRLTVLIPLLILLVVFPLDPLTGLVLLLTSPVIPVFMVLIGKLSEHMTQQRWNTLNWMSAHFLDVLQGLTTLKLFGRDQIQVARVRAISDRFRAATMQVLRVAFLSSLVMELTATLSTAVVAVEIGVRLLSGSIAFEHALFVLMLAPEFYLPLRTLGARHHAAMAARAASASMEAILAAPLAALPASTERASLAAWQTLAFDHVSFTYDSSAGDDGEDSNRVALSGCSFNVGRGEHIALVGPSGAGKSTVASLLLRFIEPASGAITLDGVALSTIAPNVWREQIAWVPQMPYLFNATVAENIRLSRSRATLEDVMAAAQAAHAHEFIGALPQGYDTILGERGARLSGGQAQRIALARAFLRDVPILILDEATSHLDPTSEATIHAALERLAAGRTLIAITHHQATLSIADRILVMRHGRIIEERTPAAQTHIAAETGGREGAA